MDGMVPKDTHPLSDPGIQHRDRSIRAFPVDIEG